MSKSNCQIVLQALLTELGNGFSGIIMIDRIINDQIKLLLCLVLMTDMHLNPERI